MADWLDYEFDFFISHAGEDKATIAAPLSVALERRGLRVWFDAAQILPGDRLRRRIDEGLRQTHCGIVVLSPDFLRKEWTQRELDALMAREADGTRIVPILHRIGLDELRRNNPLLADYVSLSTEDGIDPLAARLAEVAERKWGFKPDYRQGEYHEQLPFPLDVLPPALGAIEALFDPATWPALDATEDVSQRGVWMGSDNARLVEIGFDLFRPLLLYGQRERTLERSVARYDDLSCLVFELLRLSFDAWTREYDLANRYGMEVVYEPRTKGWRRLREAEPARYLLQGLNRDELAATLKALEDEVPRGLAEVETADVAAFYDRAFRTRCHGYKETGLLFNALYRFRPADRPVFVALLMLFHASWRLALEVARGAPVAPPLDAAFLQELQPIVDWADGWPDAHRAVVGMSCRTALHRYVAAQLPDRFVGPLAVPGGPASEAGGE